MGRQIIEWKDMEGDWQQGYLVNLIPMYIRSLQAAIDFFWTLIHGFDSDKRTQYFRHIPTFVEAQFSNLLKDIDMRHQLMTALAYHEVYKIFTIEYTQFIGQLQRKYGVSETNRGISENGFLKDGRRFWPKEKISNKLEQHYAKMINYNTFRNKLAHNNICFIQYGHMDVHFEKFLQEIPGIIFRSDVGMVLRPINERNSTELSKNDIVRNIFSFNGGSFVNQFVEDSATFFQRMVIDFYPEFTPPPEWPEMKP